MPNLRPLLVSVFLLASLSTVVTTTETDAAPRHVRVLPDTLSIPMQRYTILPAMRPARKTVGLALSGGGANGLAQIGVLKAFEEEGIPVDFIAGTSMGAVIGGLYSCGYTPDELKEIAHTLPWGSIVSIGNNEYSRSNIFLEQQRVRDRSTIAIRFEKLKLIIPRSLSSAQALTETLDLLALNSLYSVTDDFSSLPVKFRAVTTDLVSGKRVTLSSGSLSEAMRASSTIPVLFSPIARGHRQLVDGGLVANLPVDELESFNAGYKVAVDTHGSMYSTGRELDLPWKAADQALTILTKLQYPAQLEKADIVIRPELQNRMATDFSKIDSLVVSGYAKGKALAGTIRRSIEKQRKSSPAKRSIAGYTKKISFPRESQEFIEHYHIVAGIVRNATNTRVALRELLETDLFTRVHAEVDSRGKLAVFHLTPLPEIRQIQISGGPPDALSPNEQRTCFSPLIERVYTNKAGTRALESLVRAYRDKGYSLVHITRTGVTGSTLQVRVSSGKADAITVAQDRNITGPTPVNREIKVDTTTVVRLREARSSVKNLYDTGVFNRVSVSAVSTAEGDDERTLLKFSLDEKPASVLRIGLRYDETSNAQFLLDYRNENLAGTTNSLGGWLKVGQKNNVANIEYNMPRIGSTNFTMSSKLFYDKHDFDNASIVFDKQFFNTRSYNSGTYDIQKYGFSTAFGTRIRKNGKFIADITLQNSKSSTDSEQADRFTTENMDLLSLGSRITIDSRDNALIATKGSYTDLRYAVTTPAMQNENLFWQLSGTHEQNIPVAEHTTLQLSGQFGISSVSVPLSEKFFLGGPGTSYSRRFIGLQENALPGNNIASAGVQLQCRPPFDIIFPTALRFNYNAGNAWESRDQIALSRLIHGIGTSLVWETPIGPARFTAAKAFSFLRQADEPESSTLRFADTVFYFSLGHDF